MPASAPSVAVAPARADSVEPVVSQILAPNAVFSLRGDTSGLESEVDDVIPSAQAAFSKAIASQAEESPELGQLRQMVTEQATLIASLQRDLEEMRDERDTLEAEVDRCLTVGW